MTTFNPTQPFIPQQTQTFIPQQTQTFIPQQTQTFAGGMADFNQILEQMRRDNERMLREFQQQQQQIIQTNANQNKYQQAIMNRLQSGLGFDSWSDGQQQNQQRQNQQKSTPRISTDNNTSQTISRYLAKDMWADK